MITSRFVGLVFSPRPRHVARRGLGWDEEREVGVVLHMVSAIAVAGRIGLTAIGDTLVEAQHHYYDVKHALDEAVGVT